MDVLKCFHCFGSRALRLCGASWCFTFSIILFGLAKLRAPGGAVGAADNKCHFCRQLAPLSDHQRIFSLCTHRFRRKTAISSNTPTRLTWHTSKALSIINSDVRKIYTLASSFVLPSLINAQFIKWTCCLCALLLAILFSHLRNWILIDRSPSISLPH